MLLYIVCHAPAGQHGDPRYPNDSLRPLTSKGKRRFDRLVKRLAARTSMGVDAGGDQSAGAGCRQTAEILVARVRHGAAKLLGRDELAPAGPWHELIGWTNSAGDSEVAWVGHAPDVDQITAALIGSADANLAFAKGGIAAIRFAEEIAVGEGELCWFVRPKLVE